MLPMFDSCRGALVCNPKPILVIWQPRWFEWPPADRRPGRALWLRFEQLTAPKLSLWHLVATRIAFHRRAIHPHTNVEASIEPLATKQRLTRRGIIMREREL